jgi:hypothetical protein
VPFDGATAPSFRSQRHRPPSLTRLERTQVAENAKLKIKNAKRKTKDLLLVFHFAFLIPSPSRWPLSQGRRNQLEFALTPRSQMFVAAAMAAQCAWSAAFLIFFAPTPEGRRRKSERRIEWFSCSHKHLAKPTSGFGR